MRFIVDVDLTVVDAIGGEHGWIQWLINQGLELKPEFEDWKISESPLPYAIHDMFEDYQDKGVDAYQFWGEHGLYQKLTPLPGSVEVINRLVDDGHEVVFCSFCVHDHWKSKHKFLKDHFFDDCKIVMVDDPLAKSMVKGDVYIDDRYEYLQRADENSVRILKRSRYKQYSNVPDSCKKLSGWDYNTFIELLYNGPRKLSQGAASRIIMEAHKQVSKTPGYRFGQALCNSLPYDLIEYDMKINEAAHSQFFNTLSVTLALSYFYENFVE